MEKLPELESEWQERPEPAERQGSWAFQLALCLLGPLFFLSYVFMLAPLPSLYLHTGTPNLKAGRLWAILGAAIGTGLAFTVKGWFGAMGFFFLAALPALVLGELLVRRTRPERAVLGAMIAVALSATVTAWVGVRSKGLDPVPAVRAVVEYNVGVIAKRLAPLFSPDIESASSPAPQDIEWILRAPDLIFHKHPGLFVPALFYLLRSDLQELAKSPAKIYEEMPGSLISFLLILCTVPCLALIRWNPKGFLRRTGIPRDFLRKWRTPEWFVWPALFCFAFLIFEVDYLSLFARNLALPIVLIYFFHGTSILAYFLDSQRLRGPFRLFFYGATIAIWPLVVGFGFFDLWFHFREGGPWAKST